MSAECYPITTLPHVSKLYREYLAMGEAESPVRKWYGAAPLGQAWMKPVAPSSHADALADALDRQSREFGAGEKTLANIAKLRAGARAIVTGQQVGLLGVQMSEELPFEDLPGLMKVGRIVIVGSADDGSKGLLEALVIAPQDRPDRFFEL